VLKVNEYSGWMPVRISSNNSI